MKRSNVFLIVIVILILALAAALIALNFTETGNDFTAENFVKNEATYKFDGIPETFRSTGVTTLDCPFCREFHFEYQSRNSGYGNRSGMITAPVITDHKAIVIMEGGNIRSAILDEIWDMKAQKIIEERTPVNRDNETVR